MKAQRKVERPLSPAEIGRMVTAFDSIIAGENDAAKRDDATVSKMIFLLAVESGVRKGEALGLRWRSVKLADPAGARIVIEESRVVGESGPPKSEAGRRKIALSPQLAEALARHLSWTRYDADDDLVLCNPRKGSAFDAMVYSFYFRRALVTADIEDAESYRPFHGLRRTSLTNAAAAGVGVQALRTRAGHSSFTMTQEYISLADETFAEESALAAERLWGAIVTQRN
jgi:integrase